MLLSDEISNQLTQICILCVPDEWSKTGDEVPIDS